MITAAAFARATPASASAQDPTLPIRCAAQAGPLLLSPGETARIARPNPALINTGIKGFIDQTNATTEPLQLAGALPSGGYRYLECEITNTLGAPIAELTLSYLFNFYGGPNPDQQSGLIVSSLKLGPIPAGESVDFYVANDCPAHVEISFGLVGLTSPRESPRGLVLIGMTGEREFHLAASPDKWLDNLACN